MRMVIDYCHKRFINFFTWKACNAWRMGILCSHTQNGRGDTDMKLYTVNIGGVTEQYWAIGENEALQNAQERYAGMVISIEIVKVETF